MSFYFDLSQARNQYLFDYKGFVSKYENGANAIKFCFQLQTRQKYNTQILEKFSPPRLDIF